MADFFKFPSTVHLSFLGDQGVRDDKCMSLQERDEFLSEEIIVEEKVDGANLGVSFNDGGNVLLQNRGHRLTAPLDGQWRPLRKWVERREDRLFEFAEGIYLRRDEGEWLGKRSKLVRPAFRQSIETHWSRRGIRPNVSIGKVLL